MQVSLDAFEKKSTALELELVNARKDHDKTIQKIREFEHKCSELGQNVKRCLFFCFHFSCFTNSFSFSGWCWSRYIIILDLILIVTNEKKKVNKNTAGSSVKENFVIFSNILYCYCYQRWIQTPILQILDCVTLKSRLELNFGLLFNHESVWINLRNLQLNKLVYNIYTYQPTCHIKIKILNFEIKNHFRLAHKLFSRSNHKSSFVFFLKKKK